MALLNYSTSIDAHKTIGQIMKVLQSFKAKSINIRYDGFGNPDGLQFTLLVQDHYLPFDLPARPKNILAVLKRQKVAKGLCTDEQSVRIAWRIIKDWIEAQCAIIESEQAKAEEVFFPYLVSQGGTTIFEGFMESGMKMLK